MGYLKRFTDFCAALAAAHGAVYLLIRFMSYNPADVTSKAEKLKLFLDKESVPDYRSLVVLVFVLFLSAFLGRILRKLPLVTLPVSLMSFLFCLYLFDCQKLYERPMLYLILGGLHVLGNLAECILRDREQEKRRSWLAANIIALTPAFFAGFMLYRLDRVSQIPVEELAYFDSQIYVARILEESFDPLKTLILLCLICVAVSLIFRLYYVDAVCSLIPFVYGIYLWLTDGFETFFPVIVPVLGLSVLSRWAVMLCVRATKAPPKPVESPQEAVAAE
ncbi:MAG: hypothetical protein IJY42_02850 [Clostridia bacterium]|nr:hypothetical protein [Clostridia bacterium]